MYDVIYIDSEGAETLLARSLGDRDGACEFARRAAAERGAGRAMLPLDEPARLRLHRPLPLALLRRLTKSLTFRRCESG